MTQLRLHPLLGAPHGIVDTLPTDKSIVQRALIFSLFTEEPITLTPFEGGFDAKGVLECLSQMGKKIKRRGDSLTISGAIKKGGHYRLNLQNSGTGARLLAGALSQKEGQFYLQGDLSLSKRPMRTNHPPPSRPRCEHQK